MKTQRKIKQNIILLLTLLIFTGSRLFAQNREGPTKVPNKKEYQNLVTDLAKELSLTSEQTNDVENLFVKHFEEIKQKMKEDQEKMKAERVERDTHRKDFEDSIKKLLSEDQQIKFDEFMKNHKAKQSQGGQRQQQR